MKVLITFAALALVSGCTEPQELAGPWEMWILVCSPASGDSWSCSSSEAREISWAAVPGETIRCDLTRNGETVMEIFDWQEKTPCQYRCTSDLSEMPRGDGYRIVIMDDQGFFGTSGEFSLI